MSIYLFIRSFIDLYLFSLYVCLREFMCAISVQGLTEAREGIVSPRTGATGGCELPCEWIPDPFPEQ